MKMKIAAILGAVALIHLLVIGTICLTGGCKHPEVLQNRTNVPAPALNDPGAKPAVEPESVKIKTDATIIQAPPVIVPSKRVEKAVVKSETLTHKVEKGDSFWKIARMYGVSQSELAAYNNMQIDKPLKAGTVVKIPPGGAPVNPEKLQSAPSKKNDAVKSETTQHSSKKTEAVAKSAQSSTSAKTESAPADGEYVVKSGDNLWLIAKRYGISSADIIAANNLDPKKNLQIGQKIKLPAKGATITASVSTPAQTKKTKVDVTVKKEDATIDLDSSKSDDIESLLATTTPNTTSTDKSVEDVITTITTPEEDDQFVIHEVVEDGETITSISSIYRSNLNEVLKLNPGVTKESKLTKGAKIKIPKPKSAQ